MGSRFVDDITRASAPGLITHSVRSQRCSSRLSWLGQQHLRRVLAQALEWQSRWIHRLLCVPRGWDLQPSKMTLVPAETFRRLRCSSPKARGPTSRTWRLLDGAQRGPDCGADLDSWSTPRDEDVAMMVTMVES
jgi:hypothetical protein